MAQPQIPQEAAPSAPQAGAAPAPGGEQGGGGKLAALMSDTFKNLAMLAEMAGAAGDEAMAQKLGAVKAQFESILDGGEEAPAAGPAKGGAVPMEAGAAQVRPAL